MLYPINLEIKDMKITIIGGGDVALSLIHI